MTETLYKEGLSYKLTEDARPGWLQLKMEPSEWAAHIDAAIEPGPENVWKPGSPTLYRISWSCGAGPWTTEAARKFFRAGLELMDAIDAKVAEIGGEAEAR